MSDSLWPFGLLPTRLLPSMEFSRQEYWRGLPCPPPGVLPDPGFKPPSLMSPALAGRFFPTSATWEAPKCSMCCAVLSHSVVSDPLWPQGLKPTRLLCPWNSPGKNAGIGCHALLQGIFPTEGSNPGLQHCRQILYQLSHQGSPRILDWVAYPFSRRGIFPTQDQTRVSCIAGRFFISWATRESPKCSIMILKCQEVWHATDRMRKE